MIKLRKILLDGIVKKEHIKYYKNRKQEYYVIGFVVGSDKHEDQNETK